MKTIRTSIKNILLVIIFFLSSCIDNYDNGIENYNEKRYKTALIYLKKVKAGDSNYQAAQDKIQEIDSILAINSLSNDKKSNYIELTNEEKEQKKLEELITKLNGEIEGLKTFDGSLYRDDVNSIQIEIALFATWADLIKEAENHSDKEVNKLGKKLKEKVIILQKSEFPKLRRNYGEILKQKLWVENIKVKTKGVGHNILEFEGGFFANNRNKQETQQALSEMFILLRFKRINYKWYEYDDEYTYYSLKTSQDNELVSL